jgi:AcrR family transcriptional regulator
MSSVISLNTRHTDATQNLILSTAIDLLKKSGVTDLTVRSVAKEAGMSERTIFRYFATREEFLDAVAGAAAATMRTPEPPETIDQLVSYVPRLYRSFEAHAELVKAALHTEIFKRVQSAVARDRWQAVEGLIDRFAAHRSKKERKIAATNINYYLSASTWHYLRSNFGLSLHDAIACAEAAVRLILEDISRK